jgi:hypothetical protein
VRLLVAGERQAFRRRPDFTELMDQLDLLVP